MSRPEFKMKPNHLGNMLKDKTVYHIYYGNEVCGFFSIYRTMLEYLYFSDRCKYIPVIEWNEKNLYGEKKSVNGTKNPFEYYFEQPTQMTLSGYKKCWNVVESDEIHSNMVGLILNGEYGSYGVTNLYIKQLARINRKYIHLNKAAQKYVNEGIGKIVSGKVLGVHVRGSDFKKNYNLHPVCVTLNEYIEAVDKQLTDSDWDKVFLATDDLEAIKEFKKAFGDKVVFYNDVYRAEGKTSVAFSNDDRKNHHYQLGLEVLRDAYTLAACEGLICSVSQVSMCARIIHMGEKNSDYHHYQCIDKGINQNGRIFVKPSNEKTDKQSNDFANDLLRKIWRE